MKSKQQIIDDGEAARRLLEDTDLVRFIGEIEQNCWDEFKATNPSDRDGREAIYGRLRGIDAVASTLRAMRDNAAIEMKRK